MGGSGGESAVADGAARVLHGARAPDLLCDELLCEIFAATAAARPDAPCIKTPEGGVLTYGEVDARAAAIARGLVARGARPGEAIGLWAPRGAELVITLLAIAKTGAAWLPFDAEAPIERIGACVADAGSRLLLTTPELAAKAHRLACEVLRAADIALPGDDPVSRARALGARAESPAFIIYTSGSTGTPKGVAITNRNICHYLRAANEIYGVTHSDVVYQGTSAAFDMSVEEIWLAFLSGASLFVATPEIVAETELLPDVLEKAGVTVFDTVPTLLSVLPRDPATLRIIILGGEACPARYCRSLVARPTADLQYIWPDRNDRCRHHCRSAAGRASHDRQANRQLLLLCRGRRTAPGAAGRGRRTADWRPRRGARLSQPS